MSRFDNVVRKDVLECELRNEMSHVFKEHAGSYFMCPRTLYMNLSYDKMPEFIKMFKDKNPDSIYPINLEVYDESVIDDYELRREFLDILNRMPLATANFYLCDDNFYPYNSLMHVVNYHHNDNSTMVMSVDNHPLSTVAKNKMHIEDACTKLEIPEEKLILFTNKSLEKAKHRLPSNDAMDAIKLKEVVNDYYSKLDKVFDLEHASKYDLTYLAYCFIKDNITYPSRFIYIGEDGKEYLSPNSPEYIAKAYGSFINREGVCSGQTKLMSALLSNKYANIDTIPLLGTHPLGRHEWLGIVIDNLLFECCTTLSGPFKDLRSKGYVVDESEVYPKIYNSAYLKDEDIDKIKSNISVLRKKK